MFGILNKVRGDRVIWTVVIMLAVFSLLAVYSSTGTLAYKYHQGNTEYYMIKHLIILISGFMLMFFAHLVDYTKVSRIFQMALYIAVPLLLLTFFIGLNLNDAKRELYIPLINLTFQPSDFAKLALIMYLARELTTRQDRIKDFKTAFIPVILPVILVCSLILPANFSTSAILFATSLVLLFIGRISLKHIFSMIGIGIVALMLFYAAYKIHPPILPRFETWESRIVAFIKGENKENYQVQQAKIAIATGGLFGKMPGKSDQRNFLPHPYSDFIYAIIVEEYGLIGGIIVVFLYLILLYRAVKIVAVCPRNFGAFLTIGVAISLVFQAMINMAVAVNLLPVTGQTLPFISMGGTSIWFTSIALGIIISVSKEVEKRNLDVKQAIA
ncbi:MAG: FtsW/RodA/SpoVE family cell cycle protein [Bacteroidales bacterium]|nr:FtsW/RodA/SpoVE family cell cycle protein [Bacteroidales bacterium]